ncbi:MAG: tetratricopeptide repeat protein [Chthoniobacteraceae bacterium]
MIAISSSLFAQEPKHYPPPLITVDGSPSPTPAATPKAELSSEGQKVYDEGMKSFEKGDLEKARKQFQKLLQLLPDNPVGLINLGAVEIRLKLFTEAETHLKRVVRLQPDAAPAWLALGMLYCNRDQLDEALAALSQAVLLDPKSARAHNYLGVTVGKKGWYSGAEAELQRAVELQPEYADAHFNLALFYLQRDPPAIELARRHYARALELGSAPDPLIEKTLNGGQK